MIEWLSIAKLNYRRVFTLPWIKRHVYIYNDIYIYTFIYTFIYTYVPYGYLTWQTGKSSCLLVHSCKIVYTGGWICEIDRWFKYSRLVAMSLMNSHEFAKSARKSRCKLWKTCVAKLAPHCHLWEIKLLTNRKKNKIDESHLSCLIIPYCR